MSSEEWLNAEVEFDAGTSDAVASILETLAQTLREAPEGRRYDGMIDLYEIPTGTERSESDTLGDSDG